jgi:hypothetical protein
MSAKVLGRITVADRPRGPDVELRIAVPGPWLESGATLEVELPRNLACAACKGGGCDACERSGAVSVRGRQDPIELVEVTFPAQSPESQPASGPASARLLVVRVPDRGGLPPKGSELPRGHLFLAIAAAPEPSAGVARLEQSRELEREIAKSVPPPILSRRRALGVAIGIAVVLVALAAWLATR